VSAKLKEKNELKKKLIQEASLEKDNRQKIAAIGKKRDKLNTELLALEENKIRLKKAFNLSNDIFKTKKFMKSVKTFDDYVKVINTSNYWADELAISLLEFLFNVKVVIISEENYNAGESNVIMCGTTVLKPIENRGEFNPKYYIMVNHTGNHYKLIKYKNKSMFTFYELPHIVRENIKKTCSNSLFKYIPLFKTYFEK
jgi:hypothetical protein